MKTISDEKVIREAAKMAGWKVEETPSGLEDKTIIIVHVPWPEIEIRKMVCGNIAYDTDALLELAGAVYKGRVICPDTYPHKDGTTTVHAAIKVSGLSTDALCTADAFSETGITTAFRSALLALLRQVVEEKLNG